MKTCVIIPARLASTRLPRKLLLDINGSPMIIHTMRRALEANIGPVYVTSSDDEIINVVEEHEGNTIKVSECSTGTDRVYKALKTLEQEYSFVINLQGDCPATNPQILRDGLRKIRRSDFDILTVVAPLDKKDEEKPNVTKAYIRNDLARNFSRRKKKQKALHHLGLYIYRTNALETFCNLPQSKRELEESLEQLRALENRMLIGVLRINEQILNVDVLDDLEPARRLIR